MKKIALFAVAALIGTASFAAPKAIKHTAKKTPAKTESVFTVTAPKIATTTADTTGKKVSKVQKTHKKSSKTTTTPKAK